MLWLGLALVANLGAFLWPSQSPAEKKPSSLPVLLEELTITEWPLAMDEEQEQTPDQLARGER
jgi:hypothetical protein